MKRCAICRCDATTEAFGFAVCEYHATHGESDPPCPTCQHPAADTTRDDFARIRRTRACYRCGATPERCECPDEMEPDGAR